MAYTISSQTKNFETLGAWRGFHIYTNGSWKKLHPTVRDNKILPDETWSSEKIDVELNHDTITNTHNLTTDIDHNSITNTHNLTTDIDHNQLTNYDSYKHSKVIFTDIEPTETKEGDLWLNYIK